MATHASTTDVSTLEPPSQSAVRLVPYAFARDAKLLVARQDVDTLEVWVCPETSRTALAELGRVFGSRTPMFLDEERRFEPDLLFVANANLARLGDVALTGPADLVIEILSPATRDYDLGEKRTAYAAAGVPEYWMVDPQAATLLVDRPAGTRVAELKTGRYETPVLPGFLLDVAWLWQDPLPDAGACLTSILTA